MNIIPACPVRNEMSCGAGRNNHVFYCVMNKILSRYGLLLTIALFLPSCAAVQKIPESSRNHIIDHVPFYPGEADQCGPVSLAGVLNYQGVSVTPEEISRAVFSKSAGGTLNIDMMLYTRKKGLHAEQYKGSLDDIRKNINLGYPLIILVDYGFSFYQRNHFMVIVGYNEHGVIVNSGDTREQFVQEQDLLKIWKKTDFWTLLIKKE
jgi:ABC-type bacteriocin/lantibiotic exporter with double-glycine peptidase domain